MDMKAEQRSDGFYAWICNGLPRVLSEEGPYRTECEAFDAVEAAYNAKRDAIEQDIRDALAPSRD